MANPERDVYGKDGDELLCEEDVGDVIAMFIEDNSDDLPETMTIIGANSVRDENGELVDHEEMDGAFALKDEFYLEINIREWCRENNAMGLLKDVEFAEAEHA